MTTKKKVKVAGHFAEDNNKNTMSKHTFPLGHKFGGNKKKPYRTKQVGVRVPESLHSEIVAMVKDKVEQWKVINGLKQTNSFDKLKELLGIDK